MSAIRPFQDLETQRQFRNHTQTQQKNISAIKEGVVVNSLIKETKDCPNIENMYDNLIIPEKENQLDSYVSANILGDKKQNKEKITSDLAYVNVYSFDAPTMSFQINPNNPHLTIQNDTFYSKDLSILYRYVGPGTNIFTIPDTVTKIADYALACAYFSEIVFGPNVKELGTYSLDVNGAVNLTIRFNGSIEQLMYYKEMFQGDAVYADKMEDEDLENIYIICQDGEIKLLDFLYNM